jgi:heat shock protein HslJ
MPFMPKRQCSFALAPSLAAVLAILGACSAGSSAASPSPSGPSPLVGTSWKLTLLGNAAPTSNATLTFTDDNAGGLAGCNTFTASYTADASALKFGPIALTRMACEPGVTSFESAYVSALSNTTKYTMSVEQLTLQSGGGEALLTYAPGSPTDIEGSWEVTSFNNGSAIVSVALGSTITMEFDADGQVSGNGGCNQYSGGYSVDGSSISIGPLRSTMMACPDEAVGTQEAQFLAALDMVETWSLAGDELTLLGTGETILVTATVNSGAEEQG